MPALAEAEPRVEIIEEPGPLEGLAAAWNGLAERFQTPLLRHEWFAACSEAFCPPNRLHTVVVRTNGEVTGVYFGVVMLGLVIDLGLVRFGGWRRRRGGGPTNSSGPSSSPQSPALREITVKGERVG